MTAAPAPLESAACALPVSELWPAKRTGAQTQACHCLLRAGIQFAGDLTNWTARDLLDLRAFGAACLAEVERALHEHGLSLRGAP